MVHYPAGSSIRRRYTVVMKGWTWSAKIFRKAVAFKACSFGTKGPSQIGTKGPSIHITSNIIAGVNGLEKTSNSDFSNRWRKQCFTNTVYSEGGVMLTSSGNDARQWKEYLRIFSTSWISSSGWMDIAIRSDIKLTLNLHFTLDF